MTAPIATVPATQIYQTCIAVCTTSSDYRQGFTATAQCKTIQDLLKDMGNQQVEAFSFTTNGKTQSFKNIRATEAMAYLACATQTMGKKEDK